MPTPPDNHQAARREGVTRRQLLVGAIVVFLPILFLAIAAPVAVHLMMRSAENDQQPGAASTQSPDTAAPSDAVGDADADSDADSDAPDAQGSEGEDASEQGTDDGDADEEDEVLPTQEAPAP